MRQDHRDGPAVVAVRGVIDLMVADQLAQRLTEVINTGPAEVVVDLSAVSYMDSTGVAVLVKAARHAERVHTKLHVSGAHGLVARLLEVTGLDTYLSPAVAPTAHGSSS